MVRMPAALAAVGATTMVPRNRERDGSMRIAAMAAGAVGAYFGGRLAAAGHDVFFIARRANLEAMRRPLGVTTAKRILGYEDIPAIS